MKNVKISKGKLLTKLRENRDSHLKQYEEAISGWQEEVRKGLSVLLQNATTGESFSTFLNLPEPKSYTLDYDEIISQIEWNEEDHIELSHSEFKQFILDDWNWKHDFAGATAMYSKALK